MTKKWMFAIVLLALWLCGFAYFNHAINHFPPTALRKTDAVVVLTGGRGRISEGLKLWQQGLADKIFISGVNADTSINELKRRRDLNFEDNPNIILGQKATNTVENAEESYEWIKQNHIKSFILVTSNYHLPRSLEEFYAQDRKLQILPYPVYSDKVKEKWWQNWGSSVFVACEYNKYIFVYLKQRGKDVISEIFDI